ncbi:hypothetical protein Clacol_005556 [Clathrus columnatus]|uniref:CAP-Gly domain-containing protein n=1 Tax=Clathrus columnatus TaxID=1419009 RepID=A0AAV5A9P8_9AGAM|nr:hypothetical protein Clacol_005556 [Clathrus columnatus]
MPSVSIFVISSETHSERRYDLHLTIGQLKNKLESITGIPHDSQRITLHDPGSEDDTNAKVLSTLDDETKPLGYYNIRDWQILRVKDLNPSANFAEGQYTDVSNVEKFEISEEDYASRRDTVLAYKQAHQIGRFAPQAPNHSEEESIPENITLNARCEVDTNDSGLKKRGTVRFIGKTKFAKGIWVGIEYDEPLGKNDGSVQGERYFTTKPLFGGFVKPDRVSTGEFPVEELDLEEEEM